MLVIARGALVRAPRIARPWVDQKHLLSTRVPPSDRLLRKAFFKYLRAVLRLAESAALCHKGIVEDQPYGGNANKPQGRLESRVDSRLRNRVDERLGREAQSRRRARVRREERS